MRSLDKGKQDSNVNQSPRTAPYVLACRLGLLAALLVLSSAVCLAQPKAEIRRTPPLDVAEAEKAGKALVAELLAQRPEQNSTNTGVFIIRNSEGQTTRVPARFAVVAQGEKTLSVYEVTGGPQAGLTLSVAQVQGKPNEYLLTKPGTANPTRLSGNETMVPFAGSDFWIADLGLEFLHWPRQLVLKKEMSRGQFCNKLESVSPHPAPGAYSRVVTWVAADRPGIAIVQAEAYDSGGELLKRFEPKKVQKVNGQWELQEMQIRNRQTDSRTLIDFELQRD